MDGQGGGVRKWVPLSGLVREGFLEEESLRESLEDAG